METFDTNLTQREMERLVASGRRARALAEKRRKGAPAPGTKAYDNDRLVQSLLDRATAKTPGEELYVALNAFANGYDGGAVEFVGYA